MKIFKVEKFIILIAAIFMSGGTTHAQSNRTSLDDRTIVNNIDKTGQVGVGVEAGSLFGVTVNYWNNSRESWDATMTDDYGNTAIGVAHLWMFPHTFRGQASILVPYVGAGALMVFGDRSDYFASRTQTTAFAIQVPMGLELLPPTERFGVFAEVKPSLEFMPTAFGFFNGDIGARFYF